MEIDEKENNVNLSKNKLYLSYFKMSDLAFDPVFATEDSACFDIFCSFFRINYDGFNKQNKPITRRFHDSQNTLIIMPGDRIMVPTGLIFDIPKNYSMRIHIRSSSAYKRGLYLINGEGIIDSDYVEELSILTGNNTENPIVLTHGERIAQGELIRHERFSMKQIPKKPETKTNRKGGIGSTGVKEIS